MNAENSLKTKIYISRRSKLTFAYFFAMLGLIILNVCFNVIPNNMSDNNIDTAFTLLSQILCMGIVPFAIATALTKKKDESVLSSMKSLAIDFGYTKNLKWKQWLILIPLAVSFYLLTKLMSMITVLVLTGTRYQLPITSPTIYKGPLDLIKWIALTALLPAIFEEFSHRGLALNAMKDRGSEATQVFLSALLFALMHTNILQMFYAFVGGCVFGYLAMRSKSIYAGMFLHFANNALATIEDYSSQYPDGAFGFLARLGDFWSKSNFTLLLRIVVLLVNLFVFVLLIAAFVKQCEPRKAIRGVNLFGNRAKQKIVLNPDGTYVKQEDAKSSKIELDIDLYRPDGKPTLLDNVMLFATIAMCGLSTIFTYIWGLLR